MSHDYGDLFKPWEIAIAKKLVREFKEKWNYVKKEDSADLMQEVLTHWHFVKTTYDPTKEASESTFMAKVVRAKLYDIVRRLGAKKRRIDQTALSFDEPFSEDDSDSPLLKEIPKVDPAQTKRVSDDELSEKLKAVLKKLTPEQRKLCRLLKEGRRIKDIAGRLKKHRDTIHVEILRIKKIFEDEGLREFLMSFILFLLLPPDIFEPFTYVYIGSISMLA